MISEKKSQKISVVLVDPLYEGNIGSVARVMKNFGFNKLYLINPPKLGEKSRAYSANATDLLDNAKMVGKNFLEKFDFLVGTSGKRGVKERNHRRLPAHSPSKLKEKLKNVEGNVGILFGREDDGLYNSELDLCDLFVSIPTSEKYPVMNISHAVAVILYELSQIDLGGPELASSKELEQVYSTLENLIEKSNHPVHKKARSTRMVKGIIGRACITSREAHTFIGLLKDIEEMI